MRPRTHKRFLAVPLKTINVAYAAEARCKVPVVSSTPHALMNAVKLVGLSGRAMGYGSVLAKA